MNGNLSIGTPLGDPIEVGALGHALGAKEDANNLHMDPFGLISVKSCFGHTEGAAGLSGAMLAMHCLDSKSKSAVRYPNETPDFEHDLSF